MTRWAILTGEYPPQRGGVSDYTGQIARGLVEAGDTVAVYAPEYAGEESTASGVTLHRLPVHFGRRALDALDADLSRSPPDRLLIQYVPHAFGWKAMNVRFAWWVATCARRYAPVWLMVHEIVFPFAWRPLRHALLGAATALMARLVLSAAERVFVSVPAWEARIRRLCPRCPPVEWLPIPSNIGTAAEAADIAAVRGRYCPEPAAALIGHFGTFGDAITTILEPAVLDLLTRRPGVRLLLIGFRSDQFRTRLVGNNPAFADRLAATGELPAHAIPAHLQACDLLLQPYPDGVSSRRTSVMTGLANAVPVVTNLGALSEPLWATAVGVTANPQADPTGLADAGCELLDRAPADRADLGRQGAALYAERFSLERVLSTLLAP